MSDKNILRLNRNEDFIAVMAEIVSITDPFAPLCTGDSHTTVQNAARADVGRAIMTLIGDADQELLTKILTYEEKEDDN